MDRIEAILGVVNDKVQRLMNVDCFYVALHDAVTSKLTFPLAAEKDDKGQVSVVSWPCRALQVPKLLDNITERKQPVHFVEPTAKDFIVDGEQDLADAGLPLAWLAAPMLVEDRALGVMVVENYHLPQAFGQTGATLLSTVARQTAIAIENVRKGERLDRKMNALKAVTEIGQELNSRIDLDEAGIIELVDQQVSGLMDTRNMYIALYDNETNEVSFPLMRVKGESLEVPSRRGGQGRTEWIIRNRKTELIRTWDESKAWYEQEGRINYINQPFSSWIGAPMIARNRVIGVIAAYSEDREYVYDEDDVEVLQAIAGQAATAFENAKLYTNLEQIVQERTEELRRVNANLEQIVQERTEELRAANEQLKEANEELLRAQDLRLLAVLGQVTAGLIHKMSNTLGPIPSFWVGRIEPCLEPEDDAARRALHRIRDNAIDALMYVEGMNKLLASQQISREQTRLEILLSDALGHILADLDENKITLESNLDKVEPLILYISPSLISEVFQNIVRNAIQAMPQGGTLKVCLEQIDEKSLKIEVADTGVGIPKNKQNNIFKSGFSTKEDGKGLGLWFSKAIVEQHQGKISFVSKEGVGTTFTIVLPAQQPPTAVDGA